MTCEHVEGELREDLVAGLLAWCGLHRGDEHDVFVRRHRLQTVERVAQHRCVEAGHPLGAVRSEQPCLASARQRRPRHHADRRSHSAGSTSGRASPRSVAPWIWYGLPSTRFGSARPAPREVRAVEADDLTLVEVRVLDAAELREHEDQLADADRAALEADPRPSSSARAACSVILSMRAVHVLVLGLVRDRAPCDRRTCCGSGRACRRARPPTRRSRR